MKNLRHFKFGPGVLISAAFIGPGTITACTLAGVTFGYGLLWALLFSVLGTMVLQEMTVRLGLVTQKGLPEALKQTIQLKAFRNFAVVLMLSAILIGNAAYEAGNIGGAVLGLESFFGRRATIYYPWLSGTLAFLLLWFGTYKILERVFIVLIAMMSLSFIITAILTKPDLVSMLKGLLIPSIPQGSILNIIALVGTTIVPYNLFLHASLVNEKWNGSRDLKAAKSDTIISIGIGGAISMAIVIASSSIESQGVKGAGDLAKGLAPLFGDWAGYFMGLGLFAAGITSSVTAPLAAAFVAKGCFGWQEGLKDWRFRLIWASILLVGVLFLSFNIKPIEIIHFAQVANGLLLPFLAFTLLWIVNKRNLMGNHKNSIGQNGIGILILLVTLFLGAKTIAKVLGLF